MKHQSGQISDRGLEKVNVEKNSFVFSKPCYLPGSVLMPTIGAERLLADSFQTDLWALMRCRMGNNPQLVHIKNQEGECIFVTLCSDESAVREKWIDNMSLCHADLEVTPRLTTMLFDFAAIPVGHRGKMRQYFLLFLQFLNQSGYSAAVSECQHFRELLYWVRQGGMMLNPPRFRLKSIHRKLAKLSQSSISYKTMTLDLNFTEHEVLVPPSARSQRWNVVLHEPVYLVFNCS